MQAVTRTLRHSKGYVLEYAPGHPRAHNGYVYQHMLVWERANGPLPDGLEIHHRNEDPSDNRIENLEALTHADHQRRHFTTEDRRAAQARSAESRRRSGSYARMRKLTSDQEAEIIRLRGTLSQREIAERFGVSGALVCRIQLGRSK